MTVIIAGNGDTVTIEEKSLTVQHYTRWHIKLLAYFVGVSVKSLQIYRTKSNQIKFICDIKSRILKTTIK